MNRRTSPWIMMLAIFSLVPDSADACSCGMPIAGNPPCESFWRADAVFAGRAVAVHQEMVLHELPGGEEVRLGRLRYTFEVDEVFRGTGRGTIEVSTNASGGMCGADIDVGTEYFVYAHYGSMTDELFTGLCSRTRLLARADEDLRYARWIAAGEEPTLIYGAANHYRRETPDEHPQPSPIAGARIHLQGPGREEQTAVTDDEGRFQAEVAGGGTYRVDAEWSAELPPAPTKVVTVQPGRCVPVELEASRLGNVSGAVIGSDGWPDGNAWMKLVPADRPDADDALAACNNVAGDFSCQWVLPGDYLLVVNPGNYTGPRPRTFYPGTLDPAAAVPLTVRAGDDLDVGVFQLLPPRQKVEIRGRVRFRDGSPAGDVRVSLTDEAELHGDSAVTDVNGLFSFSVFEGFDYRVSVKDSTRTVVAGPVAVPATADGDAVELVLDSDPAGDR